MVETSILNVTISILGVIGTWIGVYLAYRAIKKDNKNAINKIQNMLNSSISVKNEQKKNVQIGRQNQNVQ